jgi:uncharacterized sulfatase
MMKRLFAFFSWAVLAVMGGAPPAASVPSSGNRPNILLAIADDQSWLHAGAQGCRAVRTPAFDRVAREGVLFLNAFAASPGCSPSRAALLTGRHHWMLEQAGTHASSFPAKYLTFPDLLERHGYWVGYTGKGWGPGNWRLGGRARNPAGPAFNRRKTRPPWSGISADDYAANFADFLAARPPGRPFCFWFGAHEPHRRYQKGSGLASGKRLDSVRVPPFLPDVPEVRSDLLDYLVEIEWFDTHLGRMLARLERSGELTNTLVIVTSDNGMPFPRAKANLYEYGIHMPLAVSWPARVPGGRRVADLVGFVDLTATILDAAGVRHPHADDPALAPVGRSVLPLLAGGRSGWVDPERRYVFSGRERHSSSRYHNLGYPCRAVRGRRFLYLRNFAPGRWPAGDPQKYDASGRLGPRHGGYHDIDAGPSLSFLVAHADDPTLGRYLQLAVAKRPAEELYDVERDPGCLRNLADDPAYAAPLSELRRVLETTLRATGDPRVGPNPDLWETYKRYSPIRRFPPSP